MSVLHQGCTTHAMYREPDCGDISILEVSGKNPLPSQADEKSEGL